jgi:GNAT superfamily N-acetyltransferase
MSVTFRPGTFDDSHTVYKIFQQSILDLSQRLGVMALTGGNDPEVLAQMWERRRPLFEHLANTAEHWWIAEKDGLPIGYARSILRGGMLELTEFFVLPAEQSAGVGRELLARAFPKDGAAHRSIVATTDSRAQGRYLKSGVYPRFPVYYCSRKPEAITIETDLTFEPISVTPDHLQTLNTLDTNVLGHAREADHRWLLANRQGYFYCRNGQPVGYGYLGIEVAGPIALLDESDFPAVLAHAEREVSARSEEFGCEVPMINRAAVDYLMGRGFQLDSFFTFFMSDAPFGKFENYIFTSPPFFM